MNTVQGKILLQSILEADRSSAQNVIETWASEKGYESAITDLLSGVLEEIGKRWEISGDISLAQGYVAAKIAEEVFAKALEARRKSAISQSSHKGPVIMGNIEDDYHPLGRKMVSSFLQIAGWEVIDLGIDVPAGIFVDKALEHGSLVIGVSAMMYSTAKNIKKLRNEIDNRGLSGKIQLAVGGAVFRLRSELVEETGGDGTCPSALQAPALFERLWNSAKQMRCGNEQF
jgi:methanogenic corrinoid protein MtbC1